VTFLPEGGDLGLAGRAYWNQRGTLSDRAGRIRQLAEAVGDPTSLSLPQWAQLMALSLEFRPDLIVELGRARGNSTTAFAEVAALQGTPKRILSLCRSTQWHGTRRRLADLVDSEWFGPIDARWGDITRADFDEVRSAARVLVLWDAHGFEIADAVLSRLIPLLAEREHLVVVHDLSDTRYDSTDRSAFGGAPIWTADTARSEKFRVGHIESGVPQAVAILDFCTRNAIPLHSADESIDREIRQAGHEPEMLSMLGDLWSQRAHWFWFSTAEADRALSFPSPLPRTRPGVAGRLKGAARAILGWS
jgi:hypothetical protein